MSRKYSHRGYQDSDRDDKPRSGPPPKNNLTPEERIQKRSLRHAIDRSANEVLRCHNCGRNAQGFGALSTETVCPHCSSPLHCCRTCVHFDPASRWQCRTEIAKAVGDKSKANLCPQHTARLVLDATGRRASGPKVNDPKSKFDSLFKS